MYTKERLLSEKYTWGKLIAVHEIANYLIVEYYAQDYANGGYETEPAFHPYVNGKDTNHSFNGLDKALIHCVCCNAGESGASTFIIKMLTNNQP